MAASYSSRFSKRKQVRQPPMVPFLWEDKPGMPKKDWKPETCSLPQVHPIPVKLVASVPFIWEEKPGKPLPYFSHPSSELETGLPKLLLLPPPPMFYDDSENNSNDWNVDGENNDRVAYIDEQWMVELDRDAFGFDMDDSFRFAPSVEPVVVPMVAESLIDQLTAPSSPASESGSSTSSYATGVSSLVGSSFLECLFPLVPPNSDFLEKFPYPEKETHMCSEVKEGERHNSTVVRKPLTLGELIMMSRRRSYQQKAVQMRNKNLSMEILKKRASGFCFFGTSINLIEGLQRKKFQPRLKLLQKGSLY